MPAKKSVTSRKKALAKTSLPRLQSNRNHSIHSEEAQTCPDAGVGRSA